MKQQRAKVTVYEGDKAGEPSNIDRAPLFSKHERFVATKSNSIQGKELGGGGARRPVDVYCPRDCILQVRRECVCFWGTCGCLICTIDV